MKRDYLKNLDPKSLKIIKSVGRFADSRRVDAYIVGGLVRDILLKKENLDLDFVVEGDAVAFTQNYVKGKNVKTISHPRFKTSTVKDEVRHIDFATARREDYPSSGDLPVVREGSVADDLFRRDFTINAMALRINKKRFGVLIDLFEGKKDLKAKKIRILHDLSFVDDPTRILRAVRFEQRFGFKIESQTLQCLKKALKEKRVSNVKPERYFNEFRKMLKEDKPRKSLERLKSLGALGFLGLEGTLRLESFVRIEKSLENVKKRKYLTYNEQWWLVYFMALLSGQTPKTVQKLSARFNLRSSDRQQLMMSLKKKELLSFLKKVKLKPSEVCHLLDPLGMETILYLRMQTESNQINRTIDQYLNKYKQVEVSINGYDLKRLGIKNGKQIGKILDEILVKKVNGELKNKRDEIKEAKKLSIIFN